MVKERPILMRPEMVRGILDGSKIQTRRTVKLPKGWVAPGWQGASAFPYAVGEIVLNGRRVDWPHAVDSQGEYRPIPCPFGEPGDGLWVRETFVIETCKGTGWYEPPHNDGRPIRNLKTDDGDEYWEQPHYRATDPTPELDMGEDPPDCKWTPSIFMKRWMSRIDLILEDVRFEFLRSITRADAVAEGFPLPGQSGDPVACFAGFFDQINGNGSWHANPGVWVLKFRRVRP